MGDSAKAPVEVEFRESGVDEVRKGIRLVRDEAGQLGDHGEAAGEKFAIAGRRIAGALEEVTRTGEIAGRGMKELIATGAEMAFSFGAGGPVAAAVGVLGLIFVEQFRKAREEAQQLQHQIAELANSSQSTEIQRRIRDLQFGKPFDEKDRLVKPSEFAKGAFEGSAADLRAQLAQAESQQRVVQEQVAHADFSSGRAVRDRAYRIKTTVDDLKRRLAPIEKQMKDLATAAMNVASQPSDMFGGLQPVVTTRADSPNRVSPEVPGLSDAAFARIKANTPVVRMIGEEARSSAQALRAQLQVLASMRAAAFDPKAQAELDQKIAETQKQIDEMTNPLTAVRPKGIEALTKKATQPFDIMTKAIQSKLAEMRGQLAEAAQKNISDAIAGGIGDGIQTAIKSGSIEQGFRALLGTILKGFGAAIEQLGEQALAAAILANEALSAIFTPAGIGAAIGLITLGAGLQVGGAAISAARGSAGRGGSGYSSSLPQIIDRGYINPSAAARGASVTPMQPVTVNATIIGKNDPGVGPALVGIIDSAIGKGVIRRNSWGNG